MDIHTIPHIKKRLMYAIAGTLVCILGLASREYPIFPAIFDKYPGDVLWALLLFCGMRIFWPQTSTIKLAAWALVIACLDEFSQLYKTPWLNDFRASTFGHLLFGTTFSWLDMLSYAIGIGLGGLAEFLIHASKRHIPPPR